MNEAVYIAGAGVISAIGNNVEEHLASFKQEKPGMGDIALLNTVHRKQLPVAEVKLDNNQLAALTGLPAETSRTTLQKKL
jgi:3-oxoacyl-(acyl-carrier-protein) synthase